MINTVKTVIRQLVYPNSYNSAALVNHINKSGGMRSTHTYLCFP